MKNLFNRKMLRDMGAHRAQVAAVTIIVFLGTLIFTTLLILPRSLEDRLDAIFEITSYESFKVQVNGAPEAAALDLSVMDNIESVQGSTEREVSARVKGRDLTIRVISLPDDGRPQVNNLIMESGSYPGDAAGACAAEGHLAKEFGLERGDTVTLIVDGRPVELTVTGSATNPRYIRLVSDQGTFLSSPSQFGVVFMRQREVSRLFGSADYNVFAARVTDESRNVMTMEKAAAALGEYGVTGANTGDEEQSTRLLEMDIKNMRSVSFFFVLVFLWVSSLAIYITIARIIFTEQRQIGTARALGYSKGRVVRHFMTYGLVLGTAGGVLGAAGALAASGFLERMYAGTLGLPQVQVGTWYWDLLALGLLLSIVLACLGAAIPALASAKISPAAAMRIDAGVRLREPSSGSQKRSPRWWRPPRWLRMPLRNLSRNRRRTVLTLVGLVLTVGTLITVRGAIGSIDFLLEKQYREITRWDIAATASGKAEGDLLGTVSRIEGVRRVEPAIASPAVLRSGTRFADISLQCYEKNTLMHGLYPAGGAVRPPGAGGLLVNRSLLRQVPLNVGDPVTIQTSIGSARFHIDGFVKEPLGVGCYADLGYVLGLAGRDAFNLVLVNCPPSAAAGIAATLRRTPGIGKVEVKSDTLTAMSDVINKAIRPMFNIVMVMILAIGFAIVFTLTSITMLERRQEIATVRTMGSGPGSVARTFLLETVTIGLIASPVGVLLGWGLCWVLMNKVLSTSTTQLAPEMSFAWMPAVALCVAFLAVIALSVLPSLRYLSRIDLAGAARERSG